MFGLAMGNLLNSYCAKPTSSYVTKTGSDITKPVLMSLNPVFLYLDQSRIPWNGPSDVTKTSSDVLKPVFLYLDQSRIPWNGPCRHPSTTYGATTDQTGAKPVSNKQLCVIELGDGFRILISFFSVTYLFSLFFSFSLNFFFLALVFPFSSSF